MTNIKEKVLKEVFSQIKAINRGLDESNVTYREMLEEAIDLTLTEVGKVIDETFKEEFGINHPEAYLQKELKQKLGIK